MKQIANRIIKLVTDPFGNYAVSEIIENWNPSMCRPIYDQVLTRISELSAQKYSSNVIEKCIFNAD